MEYTFCSTNPDNYDEVICPINYTGASVQIKWYVSFVNGKSNVVLLDTDDYFIANDTTYHVQQTYTSLDNLQKTLTDIFAQAVIFADVNAQDHRVTLSCDTAFIITGMSERLKYATGFHYLSEVNLVANFYPSDGVYKIFSKASYFDYLTPIWYVVSNLGSPNQISSMREAYKSFYPAVAVKIINTFSDGQALSVSNGDYQTLSLASSLNNLKLYIVDGNLMPIKFLTPIYLTVCLEEVPLDESVTEALQERPPNTIYIQQLKQKLEDNNNKIIQLMSRLEKGISEEPEIAPFEEKKQENQPKPLSTLIIDDPQIISVDETPGSLEQTPIVHNEVDTIKDDDQTEAKEEGQSKEQEKQIEEQPQKVAEEQANKE